MKPDLKYKNFSPSLQQTYVLERKLNDFTEFCASNAVVSGELTKFENKYIADISVRHTGGHIAVLCEATDFDELCKLCMDRLYEKIRQWRKIRFIDVFQMNRDNETELYNEYNVLSSSKKSDQTKVKVLIVEDDPGAATVLQTIFDKAGYQTQIITEATKAIREISSQKYDLIVLDWCLPYMDGGEIVNNANTALLFSGAKKHKTPLITCSAVSKDDIKLPPSKYFSYIDHWDKSLPFSSILGHAEDILENLKH